MRFGSLYLKNYIGIYNGMGLNEIFIDFTLCKHNIIIIRGNNGSGKSTIMKALQVMPDPNESFIPGLPATKEIVMLDNNVAYKIRFVHAMKTNGERDTTKAYIAKTFNGQVIELNENGNVTSFKDILYTELKLDANFVALSQLSLEDRGLADKRPAERKRFVNSIIDSLDVYNNIYKTLTKRSSNFKSMINSIVSKLGQLGNEEQLNASLISVKNRLDRLNAEKEDCISQIAIYKSNIRTADPNGSIQQTYRELESNLLLLDTARKKNVKYLENIIQKNNIKESNDYMSDFEKIKEKRSKLEIDVQVIRNGLTNMLAERESDSKLVQSKIQKLNSLDNTNTFEELSDSIALYSAEITEIETVMNSIGITNILSISKDEYILALETLKDIKDTVDSFKSIFGYEIINTSVQNIFNNISYPDLSIIENDIKECEAEEGKASIEFAEANQALLLCNKLSIRPKECNINTCGFISDALKAIATNPQKRSHDAEAELDNCYERKRILNIELKKQTEIVKCMNLINTIIRSIDRNNSILSKLPNSQSYTNKNNFFKRLLAGDIFEDITKIYSYIEYANMFEIYKKDSQLLNSLKADLKIFNSKNEILEEINNDINRLNNKLDNITERIESDNKSIFQIQSNIEQLRHLETIYQSIIDTTVEGVRVDEEITKINKDRLLIAAGMSTIQQSISMIDIINNKILELNKESKPIESELDKIKYSLQSIINYKKELASLNQQYDFIETIKYYSSPTTGIQLVFMELYMGKIITLANELLSLLFEGKFAIQPFIINENEFRIPCLGDGYINDDISSMSGAQLAMISMILSFSLLHHSSTKYNIIKLDELDATLDSGNRAMFVDVLNKIMSIMNIEQCILISHNSEIQLGASDTILLRMDNNFDSYYDSNIIWKFN